MMKRKQSVIPLFWITIMALLASPVYAEDNEPSGWSSESEWSTSETQGEIESTSENGAWSDTDDWGEGDAWSEENDTALKLNGFVEWLAGARVSDNSAIANDMTAAEVRGRVESDYYLGDYFASGKFDVVGDDVLERVDLQVKELYVSGPVTGGVDFKIGRQVSTWGTGDLLFLNDLFPKDWESFFAGRDVTYLKKPANSLRLGAYFDVANFELIWTPEFAPDNVIDGERFSFYSPMVNGLYGAPPRMVSEKPESGMENGEWAGRVYGTAGVYELAAYFYRGYFKQPLAFDTGIGLPYYSRMNSIGGSMQRTLGGGVFNSEFSWYDSVDDRDGENPFVPNSQLRLLAGYQWELISKLNAGVQFYAEWMHQYDDYKRVQPDGQSDEWRQVITLRLNHRAMRENLLSELFVFYSPTDKDGFLLPSVKYRFSDSLNTELGARIFVGEKQATFFGQHEENSNVYGRVRWRF